MSLSIALNNALSGLRVNQKALQVLSNNIANANTAGYSRQVVSQSAVYLVGEGAGVSISDVSRKVDEYLARAVQLQNSTTSRATVLNDFNSRSQLLFGGPGSTNNLNSYLNSFFNSLQSLSLTPESSTQIANVVRGGKTFADQVVRIAQGLQDLRYEADKDIKSIVDNVNENLRQLHEINIAIANATTGGDNPVSLLDRRDALLRDMSQYVDIQTYVRANGAVNVFTSNGLSLLDENLRYLTYTPASSADPFIDDTDLPAVLIYQQNSSGETFGTPVELVSGGPSSQVTTSLLSGKLKGLLDLRDRQLPNMLKQLDTMAAGMRDQFNRVHNAGVPFPGKASFTGTRAVFANEFRQWAGSMRIGVMGGDGRPVDSGYSDEDSGARPVKLNLAELDTGNGDGFPSMQGIVDEINRYLGPPANRVTLGNINNIRLASQTTSLPGAPPRFSFDFDMENISGQDANVFVTGLQVLDDTSTDITSIVDNVPIVNLAATGTYVTTASSNVVTVTTATSTGVAVGDTIFLSTPGAPVDGIPASQLGGYVTVTSVSGSTFTFETTTAATAGGAFNVAGQTARPSYATIEAGDYRRTKAEGGVTLDLSGNSTSTYYTIRATVGVVDEDGNVSTSQITYRVDNSLNNLLNNRYNAQTANGDGAIRLPNTTQSLARAMLVDADGNELPKFNGVYTTSQKGYLKIAATNSAHVVGIDSMNSIESGQPNSDPPLAATNRGFSHYFGLNNFFIEEDTNDNVTNAALNMRVRQDIIDNPNLISLGNLVQTAVQTGEDPLYTYERLVGDNSAIAQLANFSTTVVTFPASGGLGQSNQTIAGYLAQIIGTAATNAAGAESDEFNAKLLLEGYDNRASATSGVNLDEELANTVIYQNAYTASARALNVAKELFDVLLETFR
ncbi:MAG: flagellar hook-associated protein FlgK [Alphaproteobacteria bacterium]